MAVKFRNVILEGRFQPIHKGHVEYVRLLLNQAQHLWIFVVENEISTQVVPDRSTLPVIEFTDKVDEHHGAEKNPLPFWLRYRLVSETLSVEFPDAPITVWGGRRLDFLWPFYAKALPPDRVILTPERDEFEDAKADAWNRLGEKVVRIDVSMLPKISATQVRECLKNGVQVGDLLCPTTERLHREFDFMK